MTALAALLCGLACVVALGMPRQRSWSLPLAALPAVAAAAGLLAGLPAALSAGLIALALVHALRRRAASRAADAERAGAVEAVAVLASELRAGRGPADALSVAASVAEGPFSAAVAAASRALQLGADPAQVLRSRADGSAAAAALRGLAACLQVCAGSGGSLARATETVAGALRAEQEQRLAVETELAGPRATALMLAGLPVAGTLLAAGLGARPLHVLLHTVAGGVCLVLGVLLDLVGLWWTERLVTRALG
ncbi:MAG: tight adherence protein [Frankiales bacterium]|nr:tight adherence protein [Frankiales bacterium]